VAAAQAAPDAVAALGCARCTEASLDKKPSADFLSDAVA
jgi:hypothetical protein